MNSNYRGHLGEFFGTPKGNMDTKRILFPRYLRKIPTKQFFYHYFPFKEKGAEKIITTKDGPRSISSALFITSITATTKPNTKQLQKRAMH